MAERVLVVGAGGLGGVVAGGLLEAGHDVSVLVRPGATAEALLARGLTVHGEGGTKRHAVRAVTQVGELADPVDVVVLATQPTDVEAAAAQVAPVLTDAGAAVVLQNGLCEARVGRVLGEARTVGAVVSFGAGVDAPGEVRQTSAGKFTLGRLSPRANDPQLEALAALLSPVAPVVLTDNLVGDRWTKLAFNCAVSTLGTIGGDRVGPLLAHAIVRRLALEIMTEVVAVAQAEGVTLGRIGGTVDLEWVAMSDREAAAAMSLTRVAKHAMLLAVGAKIRNLRSSMLRALEKGQAPAVDFLNGEIVSAAARHGIPVPTNAAATDFVHRIHGGAATSSLDSLRQLYASTRPTPTR